MGIGVLLLWDMILLLPTEITITNRHVDTSFWHLGIVDDRFDFGIIEFLVNGKCSTSQG